MDEDRINSGYRYAEKYHYAFYLKQTPMELRIARTIFREIALRDNIPEAEGQARLVDHVIKLKAVMTA